MKTEPKYRKTSNDTVTPGGKNVFEDLGFSKAQAADLKVKAQLGLQIHHRIKELQLTQVKAAHQLAISQPDVSKLLNGKFNGFTVDRLLSLLNALEVDIDIVVRPKIHKQKIQAGIVRVLQATP